MWRVGTEERGGGRGGGGGGGVRWRGGDRSGKLRKREVTEDELRGETTGEGLTGSREVREKKCGKELR